MGESMISANILSGIALIAVTASISQASIVVQHLGANDPATEGWSFVGGGSLVTVGGLTDDAGSGLDAWYINDASDDNSGNEYGLYLNPFTTVQKTDLLANDWIATAKIRIGQTNDFPGGAVFFDVNLGDGNRRFYVYIGTEAGGDPNWTIDSGATVNTINGLGTGYHTYQFKYTASTQTVDFLVDGNLAINDWGGHDGNNGDGRMAFGSGSGGDTGQGNYNLVNLVVPEPSSLGLLAGASMLMMRRIRR